MLDNTNWYRQHNGLDQFIAWLEVQPENTYDGTTANTAGMLDTRERSECGSRQAWCSHSDGHIAMELYCQIGAGDHGGRQSYFDALARAKHWQERPMLV